MLPREKRAPLASKDKFFDGKDLGGRGGRPPRLLVRPHAITAGRDACCYAKTTLSRVSAARSGRPPCLPVRSESNPRQAETPAATVLSGLEAVIGPFSTAKCDRLFGTVFVFNASCSAPLTNRPRPAQLPLFTVTRSFPTPPISLSFHDIISVSPADVGPYR